MGHVGGSDTGRRTTADADQRFWAAIVARTASFGSPKCDPPEPSECLAGYLELSTNQAQAVSRNTVPAQSEARQYGALVPKAHGRAGNRMSGRSSRRGSGR
jgi:hypothetical protein